MNKPTLQMAQRIGRVACACEEQRTGRCPRGMGVIVCGEAIVVTLHGVLSTEEIELAETRKGNADLHEFHRQSLLTTPEPLVHEIEQILGTKVRESQAELDSSTKTLVQVFSAGTNAAIFLFDEKVLTEIGNGQKA